MPIALRDISNRMIDKNSNTSRLVDKLLAKDWFNGRLSCRPTPSGHLVLTHPDGSSLKNSRTSWTKKYHWTTFGPNKKAILLHDRWNEQP